MSLPTKVLWPKESKQWVQIFVRNFNPNGRAGRGLEMKKSGTGSGDGVQAIIQINELFVVDDFQKDSAGSCAHNLESD